MATTIPRTPWIDDDGSGTTGTVLNNAIKTELYDQIDVALANLGTAAGSAILQVTTTGTIPTLPIPAGDGPLTVFLLPSGPTTIQGMAVGKPGQSVTIKNLSQYPIYLEDRSAIPSPPSRLANTVSSAATPLGVAGYARYVWENVASSVWWMVAHEQGAWITAPFSAANFTTNTGTWTVEAADVVTCRYRLSGRTLTIAIYINASTTAGGPNNLQIGNGAWGGFTINDGNVPGRFAARAATCSETGAGGAYVDAQLNGFANIVYFVKTTAAVWAAATNLVLVNGQITVEVN